MENKEQEKDISSLEFDKSNTRNDYKFLVQKLKNIDIYSFPETWCSIG